MWHVGWSCSIFLPSIIKIFQRVFDVQSGHEINGLSLSNITKGGNVKSKKGRVVILVCDMWSHPVLHFYRTIQIFRRVFELQSGHSLFQIKQRVKTPKVRKPEWSILYVTLFSSWSTFLPSIIKIFQRVLSYRADKKFYANGIHPTICAPPPPSPSPPFGRGDIISLAIQMEILVSVTGFWSVGFIPIPLSISEIKVFPSRF